MTHPVFVLGCQRSGTTLMKMLLGNHSKVTAQDHDDSADPTSSKDFPKVNSGVCFKCPKLVWNEHWFRFHYPKSKYIWMIREPKDVVSSMMSLEFENGLKWLDLWSKAEGLRQGIPFNSMHPHEKASSIWKVKNEKLGAWFDLDVAVVPYELLVNDRTYVLKRLSTWLGIKYEDQMAKESSNYPEIGGSFSTKIRSSIGKWKSVLSSDESREVDFITHDTYEKLQSKTKWL